MTKKRIIILAVLAVLTVAFLVYSHFENTVIEVTGYTVKSEKLPSSFDGFKIVQVSDLHSASFGKENGELIKKIKDASPDIIVVTGDICDSDKKSKFKTVVSFMEDAIKIAPVYYIAGNHEAGLDCYDELITAMDELGVKILNDEATTLSIGDESINILGVKDPRFITKKPEKEKKLVRSKLEGLEWSSDSFTLLLSHRPEMLSIYSDFDVDLVLTGHAHGGQIRLPFIGGLYAPRQGLFPKYTAGIHEKNGTSMIISRGLGSSGFPFRINNNPELVVITLKQA